MIESSIELHNSSVYVVWMLWNGQTLLQDNEACNKRYNDETQLFWWQGNLNSLPFGWANHTREANHTSKSCVMSSTQKSNPLLSQVRDFEFETFIMEVPRKPFEPPRRVNDKIQLKLGKHLQISFVGSIILLLIGERSATCFEEKTDIVQKNSEL